MPWKNGGGETIEIAVEPEGAGFDDFAWRLSMAKVERDGLFSPFAGIDRTLCVLEGGGIRLAVDQRAAVELTPRSAPYSFPGDAAAGATLLAGPILDLNVMTRRTRLAHRLVIVDQPAEIAIDAAAVGVLIYCHVGGAVAGAPDGETTLGPGETLHAAGRVAGLWRLRLGPGARCHLVELSLARAVAHQTKCHSRESGNPGRPQRAAKSGFPLSRE
jgi:environmental stress-induced protein Ves